jgi:hypothetical protein
MERLLPDFCFAPECAPADAFSRPIPIVIPGDLKQI